jgi:hypothetical protein
MPTIDDLDVLVCVKRGGWVGGYVCMRERMTAQACVFVLVLVLVENVLKRWQK